MVPYLLSVSSLVSTGLSLEVAAKSARQHIQKEHTGKSGESVEENDVESNHFEQEKGDSEEEADSEEEDGSEEEDDSEEEVDSQAEEDEEDEEEEEEEEDEEEDDSTPDSVERYDIHAVYGEEHGAQAIWHCIQILGRNGKPGNTCQYLRRTTADPDIFEVLSNTESMATIRHTFHNVQFRTTTKGNKARPRRGYGVLTQTLKHLPVNEVAQLQDKFASFINDGTSTSSMLCEEGGSKSKKRKHPEVIPSAYEDQRNQNIADNNAKLFQLGLGGQSMG